MTLKLIAEFIPFGMAALALGQDCSPEWSKDFPSGGLGGAPPDVRSLAVFPVDGVPRLFAGGEFGYNPPMDTGGGRLGWWDGTLWNQVGGVDPTVVGDDPSINTMLVWDDGSGPALFVGGQFRKMGDLTVRFIARWNGSNWSSLDSGLTNYPLTTTVRALVVYDDGTGPALYAGGRFLNSGDLARELFNIARWDGEHWQNVGGGVNFSKPNGDSGVHALAVYDDGVGSALYVGGMFDSAGVAPVVGLARWDGHAWTSPAEFLLSRPDCLGPDCIPRVDALAVHDDGAGPALYVGGRFQAPGLPQAWIARLRQGQWEPAGQLFGHIKNNQKGIVEIDTLSVVDVGDGPSLYLGGQFMTYAPPTEDEDGGCLARWDAATQAWIDLDANPNLKALTSFDDGRGPRLWAGGSFFSAGTKTPGRASVIGMLGPEGWEHLDTHGAGGSGSTLLSFDDGSGPAVYLSGGSSGWGHSEVTSPGIVRLNADGWSPVGTWADIDPSIVAVGSIKQDIVDNGNGAHLYLYGKFGRAEDYEGDRKAFQGYVRWDGAHWSKIGADMEELPLPNKLVSYDDGTGRSLYYVAQATNEDVYRLENDIWARWAHGNGAGFGVGGIYTAIEFDDGTGSALWIGGDIGVMEGVPVQGIARYRPGSGWESVGGGMDGWVSDLVVWDSGDGAALYASGQFTKAGEKLVNHLARWDGAAQTWRAVGGGLNGNTNLIVWNDGSGTALWAHGGFDTAGGKPIRKIAKWNGQQWSGLEGVMPNGALPWIAGSDFAGSPTLYMTGPFEYANNYNSGGFAAYRFCPPIPCPADLDASGSLDLFDFLTFLNLFNTQDPAADCDADGAFTISDFACYSALFSAGC